MNGVWKFAFAKIPDKRIKNFFEVGFDDSRWDEIMVPAHWQLQGYDYPYYTNIRYPWEGKEDIKPPYTPQKLEVYDHGYTSEKRKSDFKSQLYANGCRWR